MLGKYDETLVVDWGLAKPFDRAEPGRGADEEAAPRPSPTRPTDPIPPTVGMVGTLGYMRP